MKKMGPSSSFLILGPSSFFVKGMWERGLYLDLEKWERNVSPPFFFTLQKKEKKKKKMGPSYSFTPSHEKWVQLKMGLTDEISNSLNVNGPHFYFI